MCTRVFQCCPGHEPTALDTVEAFHPQKKKWESLSPMASPRCSTSFIAIRDRLLVVGGVNQVQFHTTAEQHFLLLHGPAMFVQQFVMFKSYLICCSCVRCCSQECKHIWFIWVTRQSSLPTLIRCFLQAHVDNYTFIKGVTWKAILINTLPTVASSNYWFAAI